RCRPEVLAVIAGRRDCGDVGAREAEVAQRRGECLVLALAVPAGVDEDDAGAVGDGVAVGKDERIVRNRDRNGPDPFGDLLDRGQDPIPPRRRLPGTERFDRHTSLTPLEWATSSCSCNLLCFRLLLK